MVAKIRRLFVTKDHNFTGLMLRELSSNCSSSHWSASLRNSSQKTTMSTANRPSRTAGSQQGAPLLDAMNETEVARSLLNLDKQYKMKDGAPRVVFWSSAMRLPNNHEAFRTLALRRVSPEAVDQAMSEVSELMSFVRDKRCTSRLWGALVLHEPKLAAIPFVPYLCVAVSRGVSTNPICAFETVFFFLQNHCVEWIQRYPSAPLDLLARIDRFVQHHPPLQTLWEFLNDGHLDGGCSPLDYLWVPLQTFLLFNLPPVEWQIFFDDIVCRADGPQLLFGAAVALLVQLRPALMKCESREHVLAVIGTPVSEPQAAKALLARANKIAGKLMVPMQPIEYLPKCGQYYPLLHVGGRPAVPEKICKEARLREIEEDEAILDRRLKVELNAISMNNEMRKFHNSLSEVLMGEQAKPQHEAMKKESHIDVVKSILPERVPTVNPTTLSCSPPDRAALQVGMDERSTSNAGEESRRCPPLTQGQCVPLDTTAASTAAEIPPEVIGVAAQIIASDARHALRLSRSASSQQNSATVESSVVQAGVRSNRQVQSSTCDTVGYTTASNPVTSRSASHMKSATS